MSRFAQTMVAVFSAGLPTLTVLVSLLINNQRLSDFEKRVDQRFTEFGARVDQRFNEQRDLVRSEMFRIEQVLDARLKHLEEHG